MAGEMTYELIPYDEFKGRYPKGVGVPDEVLQKMCGNKFCGMTLPGFNDVVILSSIYGDWHFPRSAFKTI